MTIRLNWTFLRGAAAFWDSTTRVFHLGGQEICPLPEDFESIMGRAFSKKLLAPQLIDDRGLLAEKTGLPLAEVEQLYQGENVLDIEAIITCSRGPGLTSGVRNFLLQTALMGFFLLIREPGFADSRITSLVDAMLRGEFLGGVIAAKTYRGLDLLSGNMEFPYLSGSPWLLQIWLQERLGFVQNSVVSPNNYRLAHLISHGGMRGGILVKS